MKLRARSLASLSGLRIWRCHELGCRLQTRLGSGIVIAPIRPLAWEPPYAAGALKQNEKKKKKELSGERDWGSRKLSAASILRGLKRGQNQDPFIQIPQELYLPREVLPRWHLWRDLGVPCQPAFVGCVVFSVSFSVGVAFKRIPGLSL